MRADTPRQRGFIALMSAILISAALLVAVVSQSYAGIYARMEALGDESKERSRALADACVSVLLYTLATNPAFEGPYEVAVGSDTCTISAAENPTESMRRFVVSGEFNRARTNLRITANVDSALLVSLQETAH